MAYQAGTAFLPIRPSMRGFHSEIRSELRRINPVVEVRVRPVYDQFRPPPIPDQTVRIRAEVDNRSLSAAVVHVAAFGRALGQLALPVALVAAAPQIASIGAAAVATSGALGLIPATAGAAALAVGTLAVGFAHMGDALGPAGTPAQLKKINEALAQLSPNARATAVVIRGLGDEWKSLRLTVQDNLFAGVAGHVSQLAGIYLPMLSAAMAGVAASFNAATREVFGFLATRSATGDYASGLGSIETAIGNLSGAARPLTQAFTDIFVVGAGFLPGFGQSISDISSRFAQFVSTARETGQLASWIQEGISTLGTLGSVAGNVGGILVTVFKAAQTAGMDTLGSLDMLTERLNTFLSTGAGNRAIVTLFTTINQVVTALLPGLEAVASAISLGIIALGPSLQPLAASFSEIAIAVAPLISDLSLLAAAILPPLASVLSTISPLLGPIAAGLIAMYAVQYLTGMYIAASAAITAFAAANMSQAAAMAFAGGIMSKLRGVVLLLNAAFWANPIGIVVLALAGLAAALVFAYRHSETFRNIVQGAWQGIQVAVAVAWQWLQVAFAGFMQAMTAIGNAAMWLWNNALAPAWRGIVAATTAVGAAFSWLWTSVIQPVFGFIDTAARVLVAVLVAIVLTPIIAAVKAVGAAVMWLWTNAVQPAWQGIQAAISAAWTFIRDNIFNPIVAFLTGVLAPAWNVYRALVVTVWNTIRDGIAAAWAFIRDAIFNPIMSFLSGVFTAAWNNLRANITAAWNAIQAAISAAWNFIRDVIFNPIIAFIQGPLTGGFNAGRDAATAAWNTIRNNLNTVWVFVRDNIFTPLTNFVSQTIPQAFDRAVSAIRTAWNQIREIAAAPVRFMVNTVYKGGIVPAWNFIAGLVNLPKLDVNEPRLAFAKGGPVPYDAPGARRGRDSVPAMLMPGEHVWTEDDVQRAGGHRRVRQLRDDPRAALRALQSGRVVEGAGHDGPGISAIGFGGVKPHVARAGHYLKRKHGIGVVGGVGARANASDHPKGLALDFMTRGENGTRLANEVVANRSHFAATYVIWRQRINSGGGWRPMANRGSDTANHFDHVHVSFADGPGAVGGSAQAVSTFDPIGFVMDKWNAVKGMAADLASRFSGTLWGRGIAALGKKAVDAAIDFLIQKATSWGGGGGGGGGAPGSGPVVDQVRGVANRYGWGGGAQWDALSRLIQKESAWNPTAQNPRSTAYGLFQFLDSTWGTVGATKTSNPALQAEAGLKYIQQRYRTPSGALAFHNANNWYDRGGLATGAGLMFKKVLAPERVLDPKTTESFERLVNVIGSGQGLAGQLTARPGMTPQRAVAGEDLGQKLDNLAALLRDLPVGQITVEDRSGSPVETARATAMAIRRNR